MPAEASVGIHISLESLDDTLRQIGTLQAALNALGYNSVNPFNSGQFSPPLTRGSYAGDNPTQGGQPYPQQQVAQPGPGGVMPHQQGAAGSPQQVQTLNITQVQTINIQAAAVVNVYGGMNGAGGTTFDPDKTGVFNRSDLNQGGGGGGGGAPTPGGGGGQPAPGQPPAPAQQNLMDQLSSMVGRYLGGYQVAHMLTGMVGMGTSLYAGGGDIREGAAAQQALGTIPIIGGMINQMVGPLLQKGDQIAAYRGLSSYMGLPGGGLGTDPMGISPALINAGIGLAGSGLQLPGELAGRFMQPQFNMNGAAGMIPTGTANPLWMDPAAKAALLDSYSRVRRGAGMMGQYGYGAVPGMQDTQAAFEMALATGDYDSAQTIGGFGGQAQTARNVGAKMLGSQWRGQVEGAYGGVFAADLGLRRAQGQWASSDLTNQSLQNQEKELELQATEQHRMASVFTQHGDHAAADAAMMRRMELEGHRTSLQSQRFQNQVGDASQQLDIMSQYSGAGRAQRYDIEAQSSYMTGGTAESRMGIGLRGTAALGLQTSYLQGYYDNLKQAGAGEGLLLPIQGQIDQSRLRALQGQVQAAQTPVDIGLERALSRQQFTANILSSVPGAYGNLRGAYAGQMGTLEQMGSQIQALHDQQAAASGGHLSEAAEFEYQRRMQDVAQQQLGAFNQLSYGWENRLVSRMVNTPGSFNLEGRGFSQMAAVMSGVSNPHMGFNRNQIPFFLRQSTLSHIPMTGLPGVRGLPGMEGQGYFGPGHIPGFAGGGAGGLGDLFHDTDLGGKIPFSSGPGMNVTGSMGSGEVTVRIIVQDPSGNILGQGQQKIKAGDVNRAITQGGLDNFLNMAGMTTPQQQ